MRSRVLVVDDEKNIRRTLAMVLEGAGHEVREAATGEEALARLAESAAEVVLLDVNLPGRDGIAILREIRELSPPPAVVMISGQATVAAAVEATRLGAFDFLEKPLTKERVLLAVRNALTAADLGREVRRLRKSESLRHAMIGESAAMAALRRQIAKVAPTGATVLISGESGSGKELVARGLHEGSPRSGGAFVKVNCAAIPEELIETELFGCVRGAYTGADRSRDGKFLAADGGTIFLDEIGDMSLRVQAKVLRALQEGEIERVGDPRVVKVDVRVVAATNKDLQAETAAGRFREDLYFRLHVIPIAVPSLRERAQDVPMLARHFLRLYAAENDQPEKELSDEAVALLAGRPWKGNVRELANAIERLAILSEGSAITAEDVRRIAPGDAGAGEALTASGSHEAAPAGRSGAGSLANVQEAGGLLPARRAFERAAIEAALDASGGNVSEAARLLSIERSNLHKKMQALGLEARPPRSTGQGPQAGPLDQGRP